ncbi:hypothetical protein HH303_00750 [Rhodospirillaceae bacterium KN72]|uniref:Uncharacterized protein n=1 Tax=Pacificispira spongiicola TaxID=2729598 RepID=A0A7Y0DWM8_9PROT|nr:hypothetical protein [Pacificispira spongiicola]NMM42985.1 hypothetical protein [Pacificispira spongiicola]
MSYHRGSALALVFTHWYGLAPQAGVEDQYRRINENHAASAWRTMVKIGSALDWIVDRLKAKQNTLPTQNRSAGTAG